MKRVWFIEIKNRQEGPFTVEELRCDKRLKPDTLVWKEGMDRWMAIKELPQLSKQVFADDTTAAKPLDEEDDLLKLPLNKSEVFDELALKLDFDPTPFLWLLLAALFISLYFVFHFMRFR